MKFNFDEIIDRSGTRSVKLDALPEGYTQNAIPLWVADMDFAAAPPILEALHKRVDKQIFGYTMYDDTELKSAITGWFSRRYGWTADPDTIFYSPGIVPALAVLVNALTEPGDGIVIQRPVYFPFTSQVENNGRVIFNNALQCENGRYEMDYIDLEEKLSDPAVKGMILCNPHNPVGRVWSEAELRHTVELARKYRKWIISDEIHMDLTRTGIKYTPLLKIAPEYADQIITCTAPSKTFNLAGLCISNIIITNPDFQAKWLEIIDKRYDFGMPNLFGIEANIAAYEEGGEWLDEVRAYIDGNFEFLKKFCREELPDSRVTDSEGTYLGWVDLRAYGKTAEQLQALMLKADVLFNNGAMFGEEGEGFIRINLAAPRALIEEAMTRFKEVLTRKQ